MDILLIGGTGNISLSVTKQLLERGDRVTLLNRGNHPLPAGAESLIADIRQEEETARKLEGRHFDAVCDFIAFDLEFSGTDYKPYFRSVYADTVRKRDSLHCVVRNALRQVPC